MVTFAVVGLTVYLYPWKRRPLQDILAITEEDIRKFKTEKYHQYEKKQTADHRDKDWKGRV